MASIIPGYEYDIFISYRHNDNRSGWVTEFVGALQQELAATLKEPVSVYFDTNPHDGILETHNVDKSLETKLNCLIFIPVISQTYCDSKSFAWQHEFITFNKVAKEDQLHRTNQTHLLSPTAWSYIYYLLGDHDKAFMFLDKAMNERDFWVFSLKYCPDWDIMRDDPRFKKLVKQLNFPE
jgi:hypothetical protein